MPRIFLAILCGLFAAAAWAREPNWPEFLTIGTASPGGTYYAYGTGLARILTDALGLPVSARATEGPSQNVLLLEAGEAKLGFITLGVGLQAWNGSAPWTEGKRLRAMRAIFPMYDTPFQFLVLQDSGIEKLADIDGKRIGAGPRGGTTALYLPEFLEVLKLSGSLRHGDWSELAVQAQGGAIDVLAVAAGVPFPSFAELEAKHKVRYIPLAPGEIAALRLAFPELTASVVPAGSYPSLARNYPTVGLYNFAVAHADLQEDLVYRIVKATFANQERLMEAHPAAAATVPANVTRNTFLPLHPGAIRYYREVSGAGVVFGD
jgi:uncharacterized protein